jgi:hypothetical protein
MIVVAACAALGGLTQACDESVSYNDTGTESDTTPDITADSEPDVAPDTEVDPGPDTTPPDTTTDSVEDGVGGDQTCGQVWDCLELCDGDDTMCITRCVSEVCYSSRPMLNELLSCKNAHCRAHCMDLTADLCNTCLDLNCADEVAACEGGSC